MLNDRIERDVYIEAPPARVWEVVTESEHIGIWFGDGEPAEIDLRPGGRIVFDHGEHGKLPAVIEEVREPELLAFRWAADDTDGREPTAFNSTLVEFSLSPEGTGTRLRVSESGFAKVRAAPEVIDHRYKANAGGWGAAVKGLAAYATHVVAEDVDYEAPFEELLDAEYEVAPEVAEVEAYGPAEYETGDDRDSDAAGGRMHETSSADGIDAARERSGEAAVELAEGGAGETAITRVGDVADGPAVNTTLGLMDEAVCGVVLEAAEVNETADGVAAEAAAEAVDRIALPVADQRTRGAAIAASAGVVDGKAVEVVDRAAGNVAAGVVNYGADGAAAAALGEAVDGAVLAAVDQADDGMVLNAVDQGADTVAVGAAGDAGDVAAVVPAGAVALEAIA